MCSPHLRHEELRSISLRADYPYNLEFFRMGNWSVLPLLFFFKSLIYINMDFGRYLFYVLGYNPIPFYFVAKQLLLLPLCTTCQTRVGQRA